MTAPVSSPRPNSTHDYTPAEHAAGACLPEELACFAEPEPLVCEAPPQSTGVESLVRRFSPPSAIDAFRTCGDEVVKTAAACGTALLATPTTVGAAIAVAIPCAAASVSLGKCLGDATADRTPGVQAALATCEAVGGSPVVTPHEVVCLIDP